MLKKNIYLVTILVLIFLLAGCATANKQKESDLALQGLKNQISVLDNQIQAKDEEINNLKLELSRKPTEGSAAPSLNAPGEKIIGEVKARPNTKQIQIALANAGYNPGRIDGRMGRQTRDALRTFQRNNSLVADGKCGKQTWKLLKEYLYKKVK